MLKRYVLAARRKLWPLFPSFAQAETAFRRQRLRRSEWDLALLSQLGPLAGTGLDVGANIGVYTQALSTSFDRVHSFEPNPELQIRLRAIASGNTTVWPCALSDTNHPVSLMVPVKRGAQVSGLGTIEPIPGLREGIQFDVSAVRLDDLNIVGVSFMKIDVEGHELAVLAGALETIRTSTPTILVEAEERHRPGTVRDLLNMLKPYGYDGLFPFAGEVVDMGDFEEAIHQSEDPSSAYAHMFLLTANDLAVWRERLQQAMDSTSSAPTAGNHRS